MTTSPPLTALQKRAYVQSIAGCMESAIGAGGLDEPTLAAWLSKASPVLEALKADYQMGRLPVLNIPEETADIDEAAEALARLSAGAKTLVFFGTGGSGLGGQALAQVGGWNVCGVKCGSMQGRPRTRFYDNLDPSTLESALGAFELATTRFIVISKSGGTTETLAQLITALTAVKNAGLEDKIPSLFLGITEPATPGKPNGLRTLLESFGIPILNHHTGIGGRFSCLTNVGLVPALARGLDAHKIRAGARDVVHTMLSAASPVVCAPALGAATAVAFSKERGIHTLVMMPYADRLGRFSEWYVQLWAESLGKGGEGTSPIPALGPVDQHSQLQLFMDGPREIYVTVVRTKASGTGRVIDARMAALAGADFMGGKTIGDIINAQSHAVADALVQAGRPVRTIDIGAIDEYTIGALFMHFMIETIVAGRLLGIDPFDQPAVELAKVLTKQRLAG